MKQVILIGTSHIARQSINIVKSVINEEKPDVVAVELDIMRFQALMSKNPGKQKPRFSLYSIRAVGLKGFLFALIGSWLSKKLGRLVRVDPGEDMLTAIKAANASNIKIALIDQNINITLSRFSRYFSWKERLNFVVDIFRGLISPKSEIEKLGIDKLDLSKVPSEELIEKVLYKTKSRYPNIFRVLVHERNVFMVKKIIHLMSREDINKLIVVVGAGHRKGMTMLLEDQPKAQFGIRVM